MRKLHRKRWIRLNLSGNRSNASKIVADRLRFLTALDALIFEESISAVLKERIQLHRVLAANTWIFGEEFQMMADDRSLNTCLLQHHTAKTGSKPTRGAVKHPTKKRGIVDLMFGRQRRLHRATDLEHLVVELKAPDVRIGRVEIEQIEGYVEAIVNDSRFDKANTKWVFWALSKEIDEGYMNIRQIEGRSDGVIVARPNIIVIVRTWAQIVSENRARMQFFQESLQHNVSKADALNDLRRTYEKIFSGTKSGNVIDEVVAAAVKEGELNLVDDAM